MNKGQLTIFVIVGLFLLLLVGLGIMMFKSPEIISPNTRLDTTEVQQYVESCLNQVAKEGLIIAGTQGGYINLNMDYNEDQPWRASSLKSGPQQVPYWYHVEDCDNGYGCPASEQIALCDANSECPINSRSEQRSIQKELQNYINTELNNCLDYNNINNFNIEQLDQPKSQVQFTQDNILIKLLLPLELSDDKTKANIERFTTTLNIDFEELYRLANDIIFTEQNTTFVEENLLNYISVYSGLDPDLLPPTNDAEFLGNSAIYWTRSRVQQQLEEEVLPYLNFMQITNAYQGYNPIVNVNIDDPEYMEFAEGIFMYSEITLGKGAYPGTGDITPAPAYPNLGVSFLYPYSPIYLNINDKEVLTGQKMSSGNIFEKLLGFLLTRYKFKYDIAFPLLTTIEDPKAFGGEGYTFTFGIEGNILNNQPLRIDTLPIDVRTGSLTTNINAPQNHVDKEITVNVHDKHLGTDVDDALIYYDCGNKYLVGTTSQGTWTGTMPYCAVGGSIIAEKPLEYARAGISFTNIDAGNPEEFTLDLWPIKNKEVTVMKLTPENIRNITAGGSKEDYRTSLIFGETLTYNLDLDENGSLIINDFNGTTLTDEELATYAVNTTTTSFNTPYNQFALLTLQKIKDSKYEEIIPLLNTHTFGKNNEQLHTSFAQQNIALLQLYQNGTINETQYNELQEQVDNSQSTTMNLSENRIVDMIPGTYTIDASLFYDGDLKIPEEKRKIRTGLFSKKTIVLPAQTFKSWLQGGVKTTFTITEDQLYNDDKIIVYVLEQPLPRTWKDMEDYQSVEDYQNTISTSIYTPTIE